MSCGELFDEVKLARERLKTFQIRQRATQS
jgi:hypothetical protein